MSLTGWQAVHAAIAEDAECRRDAIGSECKGYDLASGTRCGRMTTRHVRVGCVHEHISERPLCASHVDDVRDARMRCGDCSEAGCGCVLVFADRSGVSV